MVSALVSAPVGLGFGGAAWANNFSGASGTTGCNPTVNNMADNNYHTFYYSSLASTTREAQDQARALHYDPTDIDTVVLGSATSTTDVVVYDLNYTSYCNLNWDGGPGNNFFALVTCASKNSTSACEKHELRYDNSDIDFLPYEERVGLACHETGHTVGLEHRDAETGCLETAAPYPNFLTWHDFYHIQDAY